jgi:hypothetical protein
MIYNVDTVDSKLKTKNSYEKSYHSLPSISET